MLRLLWPLALIVTVIAEPTADGRELAAPGDGA